MKGNRMREPNGVFSSHFRHAHSRHCPALTLYPTVPKTVPARGCNRPKTTPRQPMRQRTTPQ
jgi:hypothetical protein